MTDSITYNHNPEENKLSEEAAAILMVAALRQFFAPTTAARNVMEDIFYDKEEKKIICRLLNVEGIDIPIEYFHKISKIDIDFAITFSPDEENKDEKPNP